MKAPIEVLTCRVYIGGGSLNPKPPYSYLQTPTWRYRFQGLELEVATAWHRLWALKRFRCFKALNP